MHHIIPKSLSPLKAPQWDPTTALSRLLTCHPEHPKRQRKRRANFPMEKLMEQFLEQSAQAEDNFYRMEEQRLQAEDRRREAEHSRELHMLQMLGQMFSSISSSSTSSSSSSARPGSASTPSKKASVPARAPVFSSAPPSCARGPSGHLRRPLPQTDCYSQQSQLLEPDPQALGIGFGVMCAAARWNVWRGNWNYRTCQLSCERSVMEQSPHMLIYPFSTVH